ncbi:hypothetical protein [Chitinophaga sancti]|uniref:Uncharacterized protein n=1 Tax=Chitinophaga sancti TaxID=1004 RepID=A0A1K1S284_9BACT|nr:hypothetical protein [Chitinophaga sancti]WQD59678.1 hypothetical protein U0033_17460 [Chitinophaga sancti]WQG88191.1 hypothetical protein SR876_25005 [Chitinophaga sancti]SFW78290.1 hypothetical protein SAMN05661012_04623 [Chitinophaga sancti]
MFKIPISIIFCMSGALGALIIKFIDDSTLKPEDRPDFRSLLYYTRGAAWLLLAGIIGFVYFDNEPIFSNKSIYFHTGASAPVIVKALKDSIPSQIKSQMK